MSIAERPVQLRTKVTVSIDGETVDVLEGDTILDACNKAGIDTPVVCYGPTVTRSTPVGCVLSKSKATAPSFRRARDQPKRQWS